MNRTPEIYSCNRGRKEKIIYIDYLAVVLSCFLSIIFLFAYHGWLLANAWQSRVLPFDISDLQGLEYLRLFSKIAALVCRSIASAIFLSPSPRYIVNLSHNYCAITQRWSTNNRMVYVCFSAKTTTATANIHVAFARFCPLAR